MTIDKQALRKVAENVTHDEWSLEYGEDSFDGDDALIQCEVQGRIPVARIEGAHPDSGFDEGFQREQQANAEFIAAFNPKVALALLDELEVAEKRNTELTEALKQSVIGYKSCLRMGHDRIIDLGGDCDAPEVMIAGNPDIQQAEKALAADICIKGSE